MSALQCLRVSRAASRTLSAVSRRAYSAAADAAPVDEPLVPGPSKTLGDSKSSIAAGTKLFNINYFKNKADPVALEDSEYPAWLWTVLDSGKKNAKGAEDVGDLYSKSKKARQLAKRAIAKREAEEAANPVKKIPIEEQTIDLPFATITNTAFEPAVTTPLTKTVSTVGPVGDSLGDKKAKTKPAFVSIGAGGAVQVTAEEAASARAEVKRALRAKGRAKIKEGNFLSQM
ncbi:mitochondrial ribosomal protein L37-domain-containing protein [Pyronema domesticum]|nr:mitochondrial ribosomal protein L37-domain-containing protein [Pyronema domesticum]